MSIDITSPTVAYIASVTESAKCQLPVCQWLQYNAIMRTIVTKNARQLRLPPSSESRDDYLPSTSLHKNHNANLLGSMARDKLDMMQGEGLDGGARVCLV